MSSQRDKVYDKNNPAFEKNENAFVKRTKHLTKHMTKHMTKLQFIRQNESASDKTIMHLTK